MTKKRGIGIASNLYGIGYGFNRPDHAAAYIEIGEDGTITLLTGCAEIGQGSSTILAQIAAEELGIDYESVRIITADTSVTPDAGPTTASRQAFVSGNAVKQAAQEVKKQLISIAAAELQVDAGELYVQDGKITNNEKAMEVSEAAKLLHQKGKRFIGLGWYEITMPDVDPETNQGHAYVTYIYATQMAEVEVDTETGVVTVLRIAAAHDVGKALNPQTIEGQIEGSCAQGMGYALTENIIMKDGVMLNKGLADYSIPTALDAPEISCYIVEDEDPNGPYGAKGIGEGAIIPTAPAIINAIYDAVGVRINDMPASPEKILSLLKEKEE
jgi:CO/xanthine dehydrogenase Mo-binding subunit